MPNYLFWSLFASHTLEPWSTKLSPESGDPGARLPTRHIVRFSSNKPKKGNNRNGYTSVKVKCILKYMCFRISSTESVCRKREPTFPRSRILQGRWESEMEWVREAIYDQIRWNFPKVNSYLHIWPLNRKREKCVRRTTVCIIKCLECLHTNSLLGPYFIWP